MIRDLDNLLKYNGIYAVGSGRPPITRIVLITAVSGFTYGAVMGFFGHRGLQAFYSGLKTPMLLGITTIICLPSYYVINALLGLRSDFAAACKGVLTAQASLAVTLASLAPVMVVVYMSINRYPMATFFNGISFFIAVLAGQMTLARHYRPLIKKNPLHRIAIISWLTVYIFTAIQLAWVLRPFIGYHGYPAQFIRSEAWSNAYIHVLEAITKTMSGRM